MFDQVECISKTKINWILLSLGIVTVSIARCLVCAVVAFIHTSWNETNRLQFDSGCKIQCVLFGFWARPKH